MDNRKEVAAQLLKKLNNLDLNNVQSITLELVLNNKASVSEPEEETEEDDGSKCEECSKGMGHTKSEAFKKLIKG